MEEEKHVTCMPLPTHPTVTGKCVFKSDVQFLVPHTLNQSPPLCGCWHTIRFQLPREKRGVEWIFLETRSRNRF